MSDRSHSSCFRSLACQKVACTYSVSSLKQIWELDYPPTLWNKTHHSSCTDSLSHIKFSSPNIDTTLIWRWKQMSQSIINESLSSCSSSANSNQNYDPGLESPWCDNEWRAGRVSLCPAAWAFETERGMTHQTLVTASWPPLAWALLLKTALMGPWFI